MPVFNVSSARPRQELAMAIVEGEGAISGLIGPKILPDFPINRRTAHIIKATLADTQGLRIIADARFIHAPGTKFERIVAKFGDDTLTVDLRGQEIVVPNEVQLDYDEYLDIEAFFAGRFGRETSGLTKEFLTAAQVFNTSNTLLGAATNGSAAYTTANRDISGPLGINAIQDIAAAARRIRAAGEIPDFVAMSGPVWDRVRTSENTLKFVRGVFGPIMEVTQDLFTRALGSFQELGIKEVLIGDSYYNTAADGATPVLTQIWSNAYIAVGKRGMASTGSGTDGVGVPTLGGLGATVFWEGYLPGGKPSTDLETQTFEGGNYVESYPSLEIDSMIVRVKMSNRPYIGNTRCLDLISTQFA